MPDRMSPRILISALPFAGMIAVAFLLAGCAPPTRLGMVKDPQTGLMFGSQIERNFVTDATFYKNRKIKVRIRNTSGDTAFVLRQFSKNLRAAYAANGYEPTADDDFGLLVDVNVRYSGQVQTNLAAEFAFLGGVAGASRDTAPKRPREPPSAPRRAPHSEALSAVSSPTTPTSSSPT
jgi:hypothetical protein